MKYHTDRPIDNFDNDLLGRTTFSKKLGQAIADYRGVDSLVVGLYGEWGTGKTSIINMAVQEIDRLSVDKNDSPIVVKFSPWNYSDKDNLIRQFFSCLTVKLANKKINYWKKITALVNDYSSIFEGIAVSRVMPSFPLGLIFKVLVSLGIKQASAAKELDSIKNELSESLKKAGQKIVVIIDDIDRLNNSQIRDIFQLVKQVGDFPNIIYVLAMDRDVVSRALADGNEFEGKEYLEKIIQVSFEVPELSKSRLHEIFFDKANAVMEGYHAKGFSGQDYRNIVFVNCIAPYLKTLRDVNRIVNTYSFKCGILYQEASVDDVLAITAIEILEPNLYRWIAAHKNIVCSGLEYQMLPDANDRSVDYRKQYLEEFSLLQINPEKAIKCVATLFPAFAEKVKEYSYRSFGLSDEIANMHISYEKRFDLFFMLDLSEVKVPRGILNAFIHERDGEALRDTIIEFSNCGNMRYFIEELNALIEYIPHNRLDLIASSLIQTYGMFREEEELPLYVADLWKIVEDCVEKLVSQIEAEEERYEMLKRNLSNAEPNGFELLAKVIYEIGRAYRQFGSTEENVRNQLVSFDHFGVLSKLYVKKVTELVKNTDILEVCRFDIVLDVWSHLDEKGATGYVHEILKSELLKLKFVCSMATRWTGSDGNGWYYNKEICDKYTSFEDIYNSIMQFGRMHLEKFTEVEQMKLATLVLEYQSSSGHSIGIHQAKDLLEDWKGMH